MKLYRTFPLKAFNKKESDLILEFRRQAVKNGHTTRTAMLEIMQQYVDKHKDELLVTETELIDKLHRNRYTIVRGTIRRWRDSGKLKRNNHYFENKSGRLIYDWKKVLDVVNGK